jgi:hypothetical protein
MDPIAKALVELGVGGYGLAQFGPHLNPEQALQIAQKIKGMPSGENALTKAFSQFGMKAPQMANQ